MAEYEGGDETLDDFAAARGLNRNTAAWWRSRLRAAGTARTQQDFLPVVVDDAGGDGLRFDAELPNGVVLRFRDGLGRGQLHEVIAALARA
jgi:hypothetical protein